MVRDRLCRETETWLNESLRRRRRQIGRQQIIRYEVRLIRCEVRRQTRKSRIRLRQLIVLFSLNPVHFEERLVGCPGNSRAVILRSEATKDLRLLFRPQLQTSGKPVIRP